MRILALSDAADDRLWERLDKRILEGVELVLACGDLPAEYLSFLTCFTNAPILYVHGNHDTRYQTNPPEGCVCVEDQIYVHNGVRILGLGGSYRYKPGPCMYTETEMKRRVRRLRWKLWRSHGFDILLTHAPAYHLGDEEHQSHRGFQSFLTLMDKYSPKFMVHGHMHPEYTSAFLRERIYGKTRVINAYKRTFIEY